MPIAEPVSRVLLRKGAVTIGIAPECGAALTRCDFKVGGRQVQVMRQANDEHINRRSPYGASCFPLIPYASRLREGKFEFRGHAFEFPINAPGEKHSYHGDGWTRAWQLTALTRYRAQLELSPDSSAPMQYRATRSIEVHDTGFSIRMSFQNLAGFAVPLGLGVHPYFARRSSARITAHLPLRWRMDSELLPLGVEENPQAAEFERGLAALDLPVSGAYSGWDGKALIEWLAEGVRLRIATTPALQHVIVWAPGREDFFCFEPVSHATNSFNLAREHIPVGAAHIVEPGETCDQEFSFLLEQI